MLVCPLHQERSAMFYTRVSFSSDSEFVDYIKFSHHINFVILRFMHFTILQKVLYFESLLFCVYQ